MREDRRSENDKIGGSLLGFFTFLRFSLRYMPSICDQSLSTVRYYAWARRS